MSRLSFLALFLSISLLLSANPAVAADCVALPQTSPCRFVLPYGASVSISPSFPFLTCVADAENLLSSAPMLFSALTMSNAPGSTCTASYARMVCETIYRPCTEVASDPPANDPVRFSQPCISVLQPIGASCSNPSLQAAGGISGVFWSQVPMLQVSFLTDSANYATDPTSATCVRAASFANYVNPAPIAQPQCTAYPTRGGVCSGIVDWPVYIPPGASLQFLESAFSQALPLFNQLPEMPRGSASSCLGTTLRHMCQSVFLRCNTDFMTGLLQLPIPVPQFSCQSSCQAARAACNSTLQFIPQLNAPGGPFDCSTTRNIPGYTSCQGAQLVPPQPDFPEAATVFAVVNNNPITLTCANIPTASPAVAAAVQSLSASRLIRCPAPLVYPDNPETPNRIPGSNCAFPCRSFLISASSWDKANPLYDTLFILGMIVSTFLTLSWLIFDDLAKEYTLKQVIFADFVFHLGGLISYGIYPQGKDITWAGCLNNSDFAGLYDHSTANNPNELSRSCILQGTILFTLSHLLQQFWLIFLADLFMKIVLNRRFTPQETTKLKWIYSIFAYSVSFIFAIVALGQGRIGKNQATPYCFLDSRAPVDYDFDVVYYPMIVRGVIGSILWTAIMIQLIRTAQLMKSHQSKSKNNDSHSFNIYYFRLSGVLGMFLIEFLYFFSSRMVNKNQENEFRDASAKFIQCLLTNAWTSDPQAICGDAPNPTLNVEMWLWNGLNFGTTFLLFAIIATQKRLYALWGNLLYRGAVRIGMGRFFHCFAHQNADGSITLVTSKVAISPHNPQSPAGETTQLRVSTQHAWVSSDDKPGSKSPHFKTTGSPGPASPKASRSPAPSP